MHLDLDSAFSTGAMVGHAGYVLLILSMLMTRMLWLRVIAIGAGVLQALYYGVWLSDPVGTFWESMFVLTNVGQIAYIAYRNRMANFTPDERAFYEIAIPTLEPADAHRLIREGRWMTVNPGTVLTREGELPDDLAFIVSGDIEISVGGRKVGACSAGSFIGEISVSTGSPASATATAVTPVRYLAFARPFVAATLDRRGEIGQALEAAFRHGLRDKLLRTNAAMLTTPPAAAPITP
ncbi:MAG: cyclic nucleotide-binding domain-containing protein [Bauldia sp.]|nr:cyclic nucleotide-binding domain-containing protein [Bauldia sp.]